MATSINQHLNPIKRLIHFLLAVWFALGVILSFMVLVIPGFILIKLNSSNPSTVHKIRRNWLKFSLFWGGVKVNQITKTALNKNNSYVFVSNHTSKLDIITLPAKIELDLIFMAKETFLKIPIFGFFLKKMDIPVNLKNKYTAAIAYQKAKNKLQSGANIVIFPEATISRVTPKLSAFKNGAFKLAIEQQVEIVPVTIIDNWKLLSDEDIFYFSPGTVTQYIHSPISTKGLTIEHVGELKQQVFHIIANKLAEHGYKQ